MRDVSSTLNDDSQAQKPVVSVVIPTYKHRDFILQTLDSVWAQTFTEPFEVIVVNDGSPDDTAEVLRPTVESGKIRYIEQPNAGQSAARNRGIHLAQGEFIALLDDDDLWMPDKLESQVAVLRAMPDVALVYGQPVPINDANEEIEPYNWYGEKLPWPWEARTGDVYDAFIERNWIITPGQTLIRRTALEQIGAPSFADGPFDIALRGTDDWDVYIRLAEKYPFLFTPLPALRYRFHVGNASQDTINQWCNTFFLYRKHLRRNAKNPPRRAYIAHQYSEMRYMASEYFYFQAAKDRSRGDFRLALRKMHFIAKHRPQKMLRSHIWKFYLVTVQRYLTNR